MARTAKLRAIAPDGTVLTRRTHRTYTHAIAVNTSNGWRAIYWCGRPDLAQKKLAGLKGGVMLPVEEA
jgi:hypothetical protein